MATDATHNNRTQQCSKRYNMYASRGVQVGERLGLGILTTEHTYIHRRMETGVFGRVSTTPSITLAVARGDPCSGKYDLPVCVYEGVFFF